MIRRRCPCRGRGMTGDAGQVGCRYMVARLGSRRYSSKGLTTMAAFTSTGDAGVVHHGTREVGELCRGVTGLARQAGRQVIERFVYWPYSCEHLTIVASVTSTRNARMVHHTTGEVGELRCRVAGLARQAGRQMVARFRYRCHTQEHLSVVARCTTTGDT